MRHYRDRFDTLHFVQEPGDLMRCACGAEVRVRRADWHQRVQLVPHAQPRTGLLCSTSRLQPYPAIVAYS